MDIISLKYDFSFKHLMRNEEVRRYFISDVLDIPVEEIRSVRLAPTFLWKRRARQKQGVLDVLMELNDDRKVNIELQIRTQKYWDRRSLFYLAKMFTEELLMGENYGKLKKCICISILDFDMDRSREYHRIYHLRDRNGVEYSDLFEIHVIELGKKLSGEGRLDGWIRLFNAGTREELEEIRDGSPGLAQAVSEVETMSLGKRLWAMYEDQMREIRDRNSRDDYMRDEGREEGMAEGRAEGMAEGRAEGKADAILKLLSAKGGIPERVSNAVCAQKDLETLDRWILLSAGSENADDFCKKAELII